MIKNLLILEKLQNKTQGDEAMYKFVLSILNNESEGKQYSKHFRSEIEKYAKIRLKKGGKCDEI